MQMFEKELTRSGHTTKVSVTPGEHEGWELRVEEDSRVVRRTRYTDWHRVERALTSLSLEVGVADEGWADARPPRDDYSTNR
jgi:hypothetical protein